MKSLEVNGVKPAEKKDDLSMLDSIRQGAGEFVKNISQPGTPSPYANGFQIPSEPEPSSHLTLLRRKAGASLEQMRTLLKAIKAPLPKETGNGTTLEQSSDDEFDYDIRDVLRDARILGFKSVKDVVSTGVNMKLGLPMNDREYKMEYLIQAAAKLPDNLASKKITDSFLTALWNDLDHPPQVLMTPEFEFRHPDGRGNSFVNPSLGAADMPYARTVAPKTMQPGSLPDPAVLFDTLLARKKPELHPNRISSMLFNLASIIIHDCFRTSHTDYRMSTTSSYLDLAPLYGSNWSEQQKMRTFKDGKIKPDCFSETRLLSFPPGVGCLLIMFNRYHNYVVEQLAAINEDGRFTDKGAKVDRYGAEGLDQRDDDLFQTGRLITCGLYVNIILIDYVRTILNLNRTEDNWQLDPRVDIEGGPPQGTGNQVSAEFNLVYRWHAAISNKDDEWTRSLYVQIFGKEPHEVSQEELIRTLGKMEKDTKAQDPEERSFPALDSEKMERIKDGPFAGRFRDDDIADFLNRSIEDCANAMGPQQVPTVMRAIEILGIQQARTWKLSTLNEFREHFHLKRHETFDDITRNKEVAEALKHFYDTPDNVELYPGLVVEDAKQPMLPGSGLCPSYTVSRGVLSDAVALVRGDRYYTTSYNAANLTNWGFAESSSNLAIDNGCVFYKLFLRALPNNYEPNSIYVHYPLTIPGEMKNIFERLEKSEIDKLSKYDYNEPTHISKPTMLFSYNAAATVLEDQETYKVTWGKAMEFLMGPNANNFMLSGDDEPNKRSRELMEKALYQGGSSREVPKADDKWLKAVRSYYEEITRTLLQRKAYKLGKLNQVDIIRDVGNMAHVHFAAELFGLPLKTEKFERGIFTEQQLYLIMAAVFTCVFFDKDPPKSFGLRAQAREATQQLGKIVKLGVQALSAPLFMGDVAEATISAVRPTNPALSDYGVHMLKRLVEANPDVEDLVWGNIMGTAGGMVANQGQLFAQALDYFFTEGQEHLPKINELAKKDTPEADEELMHYLMEASRLNGETGVARVVAREKTVEDNTDVLGPKKHNFKPGDKIMVNLKAASRDPKAFPNPDAFDPTRPLEKYIHLGHGPHQCLGLPMTRVALTTMLKEIGKLNGLRPADVAIGREKVKSHVKKVVKEFVPGDSKTLPESWQYHAYLTEDWDMYFPFPQSLKVNWDDDGAHGPAINGTV
ncbi:hypothetical protein MBLNU230_g2843t1 [Neophaeotheca triangularis]